MRTLTTGIASFPPKHQRLPKIFTLISLHTSTFNKGSGRFQFVLLKMWTSMFYAFSAFLLFNIANADYYAEKVPTLCKPISPHKVSSLLDTQWTNVNACGEGYYALRRAAAFYKGDALLVGPNLVAGKKDLKNLLKRFCNAPAPTGYLGLKLSTMKRKVVGNTVVFTAVVKGDVIEDYYFQGSYTYCNGKFQTGFVTWNPDDYVIRHHEGYH